MAKNSSTTKIVFGVLAVVLFGFGIYYFSTSGGNPSDINDNPQNTIEDPFKITDKDWQKGGSFGAPVTLIEYADFQCPACAVYYPLVQQLEKDFPDKVVIVFRHYPLYRGHKNAISSAKAAESAGRQNKFFEMVDSLFLNQKEWENQANPLETYKSYAQKIGLDVAQFEKDFNDPTIMENINFGLQTGNQVGVKGTPSFYVNGIKIMNPKNYETFKSLIQAVIDNPSLGGSDTSNGGESTSDAASSSEEVHEHADFMVYLGGKTVDFSKPEYQSTDEKHLHEYTHLHDGKANIIHKHQKGVTLGDFFGSLSMTFNKDCFNVNGVQSFCEYNQPKMYVNGVMNDQFNNYELKDLDRILITAGTDNEEEIKKQIASVTDEACIYSEKCPERGTPPTENCVGGLGTDCDA